MASNCVVSTSHQEVPRYWTVGSECRILILDIGLRAISQISAALLPNTGSIMLDLVILHALGKRFSLLHLAALLLVYRLYTLFIQRPYNTAAEPQQAISAIFVCSLTSIAVFGLLSCSQPPVLHENGLKAFCVSLICFLFTAICSPLKRQQAT